MLRIGLKKLMMQSQMDRMRKPMYAFDHIRCYYWEFGPFQTYWRYMLMC
jgi:hypothetical protein